jgi:hypothetical protein
MVLTEAEIDSFKNMYGKQVYNTLRDLVKEKKITVKESVEFFELWLLEKGFIHTQAGWIKKEDMANKGLIFKNGKWVIQQRQEFVEKVMGFGRSQRILSESKNLPSHNFGRPQERIPLPYADEVNNKKNIDEYVEVLFN